MEQPRSCDTFVVLPPGTKNGQVIFGKNSDRPCAEVQEVVYNPAQDHEPGSKLECTYIEIDQVAHTYATVLSKPAWMWGAEMGSNEHGVCIGNEAVWTKLNGPEDIEEKLLGMDLVRLGLERSKTAKEALDTLTSLIGSHGQGGPCSDEKSQSKWAYHNSFLLVDSTEAWVLETAGAHWAAEQVTSLERAASARQALDVVTSLFEKYGQGGPCSDSRYWGMTYHNSFIICDQSEAWVLETAGHLWAAEHITCGIRNISNQLTIGTKIDLMSDGLKEFAESKGWWNPDDGDFHFAKAYADSYEEAEIKEGGKPCGRQQWGTKLLKDMSQDGNFSVDDMFRILRHEASGICMTGSFLSTGSQVSVLTPGGSTPCVHWFTATPNPMQSLFKPFIFTAGASIGEATVAPSYGDTDPRKVKPRFEKVVDRRHPLYQVHEKFQNQLDQGASKGGEVLIQMQELEKHCVEDIDEILSKYDVSSAGKVAQIFKHMVEIEMNFYK